MDLLWAIADVVYRFMESGPGWPMSLVYILIVAIPVTLLHELGHAVAARRLLGDAEIEVGTFGRFAELELAQISVSLNALPNPVGAAGVTEYDDSEATARDVLYIALAGPAASLAGTIVTTWLFSHVTSPAVLRDLLWAATLAGVFGVLNMVPLTYQDTKKSPATRTDGRLALDALRVVRELR